jgi:hypothetical protein
MTHQDDAVLIITALHDGPDWGKIRITEEMKYQP